MKVKNTRDTAYLILYSDYSHTSYNELIVCTTFIRYRVRFVTAKFVSKTFLSGAKKKVDLFLGLIYIPINKVYYHILRP